MPRRATGFLRTATLSDGSEVWRVQIRTTDGRRLQRTLGKTWRKRSAPPSGHLTEGQAKARLETILAGDDSDISWHRFATSGARCKGLRAGTTETNCSARDRLRLRWASERGSHRSARAHAVGSCTNESRGVMR